MDQGWVKIHRSVFESGFWQDSEAVHLWLHLLLKASHKKTKTIWNGRIKELNPGELITGRKKLSQETGISEKSIRRILNLFEMGQQIGQQKSSGGSCISILNWQKYQEKGQPIGQQGANDGPTEGQQGANDGPLYKNDKNDKNVKNNYDDGEKNFSNGAVQNPAPAKTETVSHWKMMYLKMSEDVQFLEMTCMRFRIKFNQLVHQAHLFFMESKAKDKQWDSYTECREHFFNWCNRRGEAIREPVPETQKSIEEQKKAIDEFYNSRMGPADRLGYVIKPQPQEEEEEEDEYQDHE